MNLPAAEIAEYLGTNPVFQKDSRQSHEVKILFRIKFEVLTSIHVNEFSVPDELAIWIGKNGNIKVFNYSNQSVKIYYYHNVNGHFAYEIKLTVQDNSWQMKTWKVV